MRSNFLSWLPVLAIMACSSQPRQGKATRCASLHDRLTKCMLSDEDIPSTVSLKPRDEFVRRCVARYAEARPAVDCIDRDGCAGFRECFINPTRQGRVHGPSAEQ
ncbi:MAG: hypothetical protein CVU65_10595 [Deltaproteobacteria bacterium HGW-Deltaproteobacteria-22]|jgi:hypothetical protein|nr:MAG: hypothetical protein CVU65_10595 [Deltaproteobacteria bacterium HGW-Deltaproteobacteria-22]